MFSSVTVGVLLNGDMLNEGHVSCIFDQTPEDIKKNKKTDNVEHFGISQSFYKAHCFLSKHTIHHFDSKVGHLNDANESLFYYSSLFISYIYLFLFDLFTCDMLAR